MGRQDTPHKKQQRVVEKQQVETIPGGQSLRRVQARMELDLHPSKLGDVQAGVYELLNSMVFQYDEGLQGVVLAFSAPEILSQHVDVQPYFPLCRVPVNVQLTVFSPQKGDLLMGRVTQLGPDFVGLLVLGVINASVAKAQMGSDWVWDAQAFEWRSRKHPDHKIDMQSHVRFHVAGLETADAFFGVQGSLAAAGTGSLAFLLGPGQAGQQGQPSGGSKKDKKEKKKDKAKHKAKAQTGAEAEPELPVMASSTKPRPTLPQQEPQERDQEEPRDDSSKGEAGGASKKDKKRRKKDKAAEEEQQQRPELANGVGGHHAPQEEEPAAATGKHKGGKKGKGDGATATPHHGEQQQQQREEEGGGHAHANGTAAASAAAGATGKKRKKGEEAEQRPPGGEGGEGGASTGHQKERKKHKKDKAAS